MTRYFLSGIPIDLPPGSGDVIAVGLTATKIEFRMSYRRMAVYGELLGRNDARRLRGQKGRARYAWLWTITMIEFHEE